jgi:hypothetical protein
MPSELTLPMFLRLVVTEYDMYDIASMFFSHPLKENVGCWYGPRIFPSLLEGVCRETRGLFQKERKFHEHVVGLWVGYMSFEIKDPYVYLGLYERYMDDSEVQLLSKPMQALDYYDPFHHYKKHGFDNPEEKARYTPERWKRFTERIWRNSGVESAVEELDNSWFWAKLEGREPEERPWEDKCVRRRMIAAGNHELLPSGSGSLD